MTSTFSMLALIIACAIVTFIPRVVPFIIVRRLQLPEVVLKWLSYIPVCILTALVVENVILQTDHSLQVDWTAILALIPTLIIALWTKSLALTVVIGVITMALIRFLF